MCGKDHVTSVIGEYRLLLARGVIEELIDLVHRSFRWFGLFGCDCTEGDEHCDVDGAGII